jgi:hypothetical protein
MGFAWPHVGGDEEFYGILHEHAGYPAWRWEYDVTRNEILPRLGSGRIMDIGTGDGAFLKGLPEGWEAYATEGSETTRIALRADGIRCFSSTNQALAEAAGTMAAITMFQVFEHIADFREMLADCCKLLRVNGVLVISVPFGEATFVQEQLTGCADMPPNHVNKWSPQALSLAMRSAGLEPDSPRMQPGSRHTFFYRSMLSLRASIARSPNGIASRIYGIRSRHLRQVLLALICVGSALRRLPRYRQLSSGHSFLLVGRKT